MIEPGEIFEVPAVLADPPQRGRDPNAPARQHRWAALPGSVMADTLRQVRAKLSDTLGISPGA